MNYTKLINGYSFKLVLLIISSEKKNKLMHALRKKGEGYSNELMNINDIFRDSSEKTQLFSRIIFNFNNCSAIIR